MNLKNVLILFICVFGLISCKQNKEQNDEVAEGMKAVSFGKHISETDVLDPIDAIMQYEIMSVGDTIISKIKGKVSRVSQSKSSWMALNLEDGNEILVKFKNNSFVVPKAIVGKEVLITGVAYIENMSVDKQKQYAKEAGKPTAHITTIRQPRRTLCFEADGVLINQ